MVGTHYKPPCTGNESHMSGLELIDKKAYDKKETVRLARIKNMKSRVDNKAPTRFTHILHNRKKQMKEVDRFSAIERENYRLLARMSSIMTHQHHQDYVPPLCPSLDMARQRTRKHRALAGENAVMQRRLRTAKSHYDTEGWKNDMERHDHAMQYLCRYPRVLEPLSSAGIWMSSAEVSDHSLRATSPTSQRSTTSMSEPALASRKSGRSTAARGSRTASACSTRPATSADGMAMDGFGRPGTSMGLERNARHHEDVNEILHQPSDSAPRPKSATAEEFEAETGGMLRPSESPQLSSSSGSIAEDVCDDGFTVPDIRAISGHRPSSREQHGDPPPMSGSPRQKGDDALSPEATKAEAAVTSEKSEKSETKFGPPKSAKDKPSSGGTVKKKAPAASAAPAPGRRVGGKGAPLPSRSKVGKVSKAKAGDKSTDKAAHRDDESSRLVVASEEARHAEPARISEPLSPAAEEDPEVGYDGSDVEEAYEPETSAVTLRAATEQELLISIANMEATFAEQGLKVVSKEFAEDRTSCVVLAAVPKALVDAEEQALQTGGG